VRSRKEREARAKSIAKEFSKSHTLNEGAFKLTAVGRSLKANSCRRKRLYEFARNSMQSFECYNNNLTSSLCHRYHLPGPRSNAPSPQSVSPHYRPSFTFSTFFSSQPISPTTTHLPLFALLSFSSIHSPASKFSPSTSQPHFLFSPPTAISSHSGPFFSNPTAFAFLKNERIALRPE